MQVNTYEKADLRKKLFEAESKNLDKDSHTIVRALLRLLLLLVMLLLLRLLVLLLSARLGLGVVHLALSLVTTGIAKINDKNTIITSFSVVLQPMLVAKFNNSRLDFGNVVCRVNAFASNAIFQLAIVNS